MREEINGKDKHTQEEYRGWDKSLGDMYSPLTIWGRIFKSG